MTDNATVKLDPRRPLAKSALMHVLNNSDHDADEQVVADMVMAMMILAELSGLDLEDLGAMINAGHVNAVRAAASLSLQIAEEQSHD